jgi:hypothetical protein
MSLSDPFNTLGGLTVGIPPVAVVDSNGNVVTNVFNTGNVTTNAMYANSYFWSNGQPFAGTAGGTSNQLQYNNNGIFGGIPNVTWNGSNLSLGSVSNIKILGGLDGYVLQTDGTGNLSWTAQTGGGGGNGSPGGSNTQVQFNNAGVFGGAAGFTFNNSTNTLSVINTVASGTTNLGNVGNVIIYGGSVNNVLTTDGTGNLLWRPGSTPNTGSIGFVGNTIYDNNGPTLNNSDLVQGETSGLTIPNNGGSNPTQLFNFYGNVQIQTGNNNANIQYWTFDNTGNLTLPGNAFSIKYANGTLVPLGSGGTPGGVNQDVQFNNSGSFGGNAAFTFNSTTLTLNVPNFLSTSITGTNITGNAGGALTVLGNLNAGLSPNVFLGTVANVKITGGADGYYLQTDGSGNLSWAAGGGGGGNGSPGGANTQVQFNNNGLFGGSPYMTFNDVTNTFNVAGNLIANSLTLGSGVYQFSVSNVYFATTATTTLTTLLSIPANNISGLDFTIVATDNTAGNRQITKLSAVLYNASLSYNEYSSLFVGGQVGNFVVAYNPGNIISPASAVLSVLPTASSMAVYKIQITQYEP